jgi:erythromycin esterase-like protein
MRLLFLCLITIVLFSCGGSNTSTPKTPENPIVLPPVSDLITDPGVFAIQSIDINSDDQNFTPLHDIVGDAEIVGLGESVHTVGGYYQTKFRLFKWLVENKGFRVFAWETPWHDALPTSEYVQTCNGSAKEAMSHVFGVWWDVATENLLQWMCHWNVENPDDRVYFAGWDAQNPWADTKIIGNTLNTMVSKTEELMQGLEKCDGTSAKNANDYYNNYLDQLFTLENYEQCLLALDKLDIWFSENQHQIKNEQQTSFSIALISLRGWQGALFHSNDADRVDAYESRDLANAKIIDILREHKYSNLKTVIWAHNSHLAYQQQDIAGYEDSLLLDRSFQGWQSTGTILRNTHGDDYKAIALIGYDVDLNWGSFQDPEVPSHEDAVEVILKNKFGHKFSLIDLHKSNYFSPEKRYQLSSEWMYLDVQYDGIFYLEHAWASTD